MIRPPLALGDHPRRGGLRAQEQAGQVDVDHAAERLEVELAQRPHRVDPRVVDEDVDAAEALDGRADHALDALGIADVAVHGQSAVCSQGLQGLGRMLAGGEVKVCDDDARARLVQAAGDAEPDPHRTAGDDRGAAGEVDELCQRCGLWCGVVVVMPGRVSRTRGADIRDRPSAAAEDY